MAFRSGLWVCGVFGFVAAVGCGGDDGGGEGSNSLGSGVDAAKPGDQLSSAETEQLCKAFHDYAEEQFTAREGDILRVGCTMAAFLGAPDVATCEARVEECVKTATESPAEPEVSPVSCEPTGTDFGSCTATVGEIEACMKVSIDMGLDGLLAIDCAALLDAVNGGSQTPVTGPSMPPSCQVLEDKCPGILQQETTTDGI